MTAGPARPAVRVDQLGAQRRHRERSRSGTPPGPRRRSVPRSRGVIRCRGAPRSPRAPATRALSSSRARFASRLRPSRELGERGEQERRASLAPHAALVRPGLGRAARRARPPRHPSRRRRGPGCTAGRGARLQVRSAPAAAPPPLAACRRDARASTGASRARKNGSRSTPNPTTTTPSSSSFSVVAKGSMIDFGPEQTSTPGRARELQEVGADVGRPRRDARHRSRRWRSRDARPGRRPDRGAHGGGAERARRHRHREIATRDLRGGARAAANRASCGRGQPHDHACRPRRPTQAGTAPAARIAAVHPFHALEVARMRQPLADHAGLQRHDAATPASSAAATSSPTRSGVTLRPPPARPAGSRPPARPRGTRARAPRPAATPRASAPSRTPSNASPAPVAFTTRRSARAGTR